MDTMTSGYSLHNYMWHTLLDIAMKNIYLLMCIFCFVFLFLGFKVITFKNPYLGNTCVPFQHWACSLDCARSVEIPARLEQVSAAREQDLQYEHYVKECIRRFSSSRSSRNMLSCVTKSPKYSDKKGDENVRLLGKLSREKSDNERFSRKRQNRKRTKTRLPEDSVNTHCGCVLSWGLDCSVDCRRGASDVTTESQWSLLVNSTGAGKVYNEHSTCLFFHFNKSKSEWDVTLMMFTLLF